MVKAVTSSPTRIGITGDSESPVSKPSSCSCVLHVRGVLPQHGTALRLALDDVERREHRRRPTTGGGAAEKISSARVVLDEIDHPLVTGDEAAHRRQRLRKGSHHQIDFVLDAEVLGGAATVLAEHADAVRVVDHQARAVALLLLDDRRQVGEVPLHRKDAIDDDQLAALRIGSCRACAPGRRCRCACT